MPANISSEQSGAEPDELDLHNSLVFWVNRLASIMRDTFNDALASEQISWSQWMCLNVLAHNKAETPAQIAQHLGIDRSAVTRLLDRLVDKDLVLRQHDDGDRRSVRVFLTDTGRAVAQRVDALAQEHQQRFIQQLPATEVRVFKSHIQKLLREGGLEASGLWRSLG